MCELKAFITSLGAYNDGALLGEWASLPINDEDLDALLHRIGVVDCFTSEELKKVPENLRRFASDEYFITDYETDMPGLSENFGEYTSIENLNETAEELQDLDDHDAEIVAAIMSDRNCDIDEAKEALQDGWFLPCDPDDDSDIGYELCEQLDMLYNVPKHLQRYFDYEQYGKDFTDEASCVSVSDGLFFYE